MMSVMASGGDYELIDAGDGRRLERFGAIVLDRPCPPAADRPRRDPGAWANAAARFDRALEGALTHAGWATRDGTPLEPWCIQDGGLTVELRLAASGQVGWFPEQAANRRWIADRVRALTLPGRRGAPGSPGAAEAPAVLNLFAYTGGSTLAAVAAGARATHLDAARTAVAWARRNAELNGFAERPVRWIADDAETFARREHQRGRRYAGVVLDPPSYGHGAAGHDWRIERDLPGLLAHCAAVLEPWRGSFIVLTAHSGPVDADLLGQWLTKAAGPGELTVVPLAIRSTSGIDLALGACARWSRRGP